jgi:hypothetical protein
MMCPSISLSMCLFVTSPVMEPKVNSSFIESTQNHITELINNNNKNNKKKNTNEKDDVYIYGNEFKKKIRHTTTSYDTFFRLCFTTFCFGWIQWNIYYASRKHVCIFIILYSFLSIASVYIRTLSSSLFSRHRLTLVFANHE